MRFEKVLELDQQRNIVSGSCELLNRRVAAGSDIRIRTDFIHNEHIDPLSDDDQPVQETSLFQQTVLIDDRWSAYFMTLRQPVALRTGFGLPNSLSLFLYNQDGNQAMARLVLDGSGTKTQVWDAGTEFSKMHTLSVQDAGTAGISKNFIYDFDRFSFFACNCYEECYTNDADGQALSGSLAALSEAYSTGRPIKLAVKGLNRFLWGQTEHQDEIFLQGSSSYYYTKDRLMISNSVPFVALPSAIPLRYSKGKFRYCWLLARSDGQVTLRSFDPFSGSWQTEKTRLPVRWFAGV